MMTDISPQMRWLAERSVASGYVIIFVLDLFGGRGVTGSNDFTCPQKPRGCCTLSVAVNSIGCGGRGEK